MKDPEDITRLLHQWGAGDHDAGEKLFKLLMPDLRKLAARCLRREHPNHSLQRSELINESLSTKKIDWRDRGHFFAIVTIKMRRFLIDYARAKKIKPIPLDDLPEGILAKRNWLEIAVTVDGLLDELEKESPIKCSVVTCRSYLGLTTKETAEMLGLTENSVEHDWYRARRWLYKKMSEGRWNSTSG